MTSIEKIAAIFTGITATGLLAALYFEYLAKQDEDRPWPVLANEKQTKEEGEKKMENKKEPEPAPVAKESIFGIQSFKFNGGEVDLAKLPPWKQEYFRRQHDLLEYVREMIGKHRADDKETNKITCALEELIQNEEDMKFYSCINPERESSILKLGGSSIRLGLIGGIKNENPPINDKLGIGRTYMF